MNQLNQEAESIFTPLDCDFKKSKQVSSDAHTKRSNDECSPPTKTRFDILLSVLSQVDLSDDDSSVDISACEEDDSSWSMQGENDQQEGIPRKSPNAADCATTEEAVLRDFQSKVNALSKLSVSQSTTALSRSRESRRHRDVRRTIGNPRETNCYDFTHFANPTELESAAKSYSSSGAFSLELDVRAHHRSFTPVNGDGNMKLLEKRQSHPPTAHRVQDTSPRMPQRCQIETSEDSESEVSYSDDNEELS